MKRYIKLLFSAAIVFCSLFTFSIFANAEEGRCGAKAFWSFEGGTLTITGSGNITQYNRELNTDSVDSPWWEFRNDITKLVVEEGIEEFHNYSFYKLENLKEVSLPSTLTQMQARVFAKCKSLEKITIPKNVTFIGMECFIKTGLKEIVFEGDCPRVSPTSPFSGIIATVTCNGDSDFYVTNFGGAFTFIETDRQPAENYKDDPAKEVELTAPTYDGKCGNNLEYAFQDGTLLITGSGDMDDYEYDRVAGVSTAPWAEFKDQIIKIVIGKGAMSIGKYAFIGCANLAEVTLSSTVLDIDFAAFKGCTGLSCVKIPTEVETIASQAFADCGTFELSFENEIPLGVSQYVVDDSADVTISYLCRAVEATDEQKAPFGENVKWIRSHDFYEGKCMYCDIKEEQVTAARDSENDSGFMQWLADNMLYICIAAGAIILAAVVLIIFKAKKK